MTTITLSVPDNKSSIILAFLKELPFAKVESVSKEKERILKDFKTALKENNIIEFANKFNLNPSIIFGGYCYEINQYKIKSKISREIY